jgi:hypothetical protein
MHATDTITRPLPPAGVYAECGGTADVVAAMVRAERYGAAHAHGARITHAGYADGTADFSAATSLFRVTW